MEHKGWYSRRYIPHFDVPEIRQMITFRLGDALPAHVVAAWKERLAQESTPELWTNLEKYLDAGHGSCLLQQERVGRIVEDALLHFDGERYRLLAWVVMPNHVHVLAEMQEGYPLSKVAHSWKSYTAKRINDLLGRSGTLWQRELYDRYIRNENHLGSSINYIHQNPVKAGLVDNAEAWGFSSARR